MSTLKDVSIIVKWNGKEFPIMDLSDQETVAVLKHEIAKLTNVRPERQKLLNLKHKGLYISFNRQAKPSNGHFKRNVRIQNNSPLMPCLILTFCVWHFFIRQKCYGRLAPECIGFESEFQIDDGRIARGGHSRCPEFHRQP